VKHVHRGIPYCAHYRQSAVSICQHPQTSSMVPIDGLAPPPPNTTELFALADARFLAGQGGNPEAASLPGTQVLDLGTPAVGSVPLFPINRCSRPSVARATNHSTIDCFQPYDGYMPPRHFRLSIARSTREDKFVLYSFIRHVAELLGAFGR